MTAGKRPVTSARRRTRRMAAHERRVRLDAGAAAERVFEDFVQRSTYLGRAQTPEEIADAAVYLCRAENAAGLTLTVAGGAEVH